MKTLPYPTQSQGTLEDRYRCYLNYGICHCPTPTPTTKEETERCTNCGLETWSISFDDWLNS